MKTSFKFLFLNFLFTGLVLGSSGRAAWAQCGAGALATPTYITPANGTNIPLGGSYPIYFQIGNTAGTADVWRIQIAKAGVAWTAANGFTTSINPTTDVPINKVTSFTTIGASTPPAFVLQRCSLPAGTYQWTARVGSECGHSSYTSPRTFTIAAETCGSLPPSVNQVYPIGGETFTAGTSVTVKWYSSNANYAYLTYFDGSTHHWLNTASGSTYQGIPSPNGLNSYTWNIPNGLNSNKLRFFVIVSTANLFTGVNSSNRDYDYSEYFTVQPPVSTTGSVKVNITPAGAVSAGAQWRLDGGAWQNSGATLTNIATGNHTISFKTVAGYNTPPNININVTAGGTVNEIGNYTILATPTYTVSGKITEDGVGLAGVSIGGTTTDASGNYSIIVNSGASLTLTPNKAGYTFSPNSQTFNNITSNQVQDFTASPVMVTSYNLQLTSGFNITPVPLIKDENGYISIKVKNIGTADYTGTIYLSWHKADVASTFITDLATKVNLAVNEEILLEKPSSPITSIGGVYRLIVKYSNGVGFKTLITQDIEVKDVTSSVPTNILSPVIGDLTQSAYCGPQPASNQLKPWSFWQRGNCFGPGHGVGQGIGGADDTYAWDGNKNYPKSDADNGVPVYAVADGEIVTFSGWGGNSFGQLLIKHTEPNGDIWYSGYLHMTKIRPKSGFVTTKDILGYVSNKSTASITPHIHFACYYMKNGVLVSVNRNIVPRLSSETKIARLREISPTTINGGQNFSVKGYGFEANKALILTFSGNDGYFEVNQTTNSQGELTYNGSFPNGQPAGIWKVSIKNVITNPNYLYFKVNSTALGTPISKLAISSPMAGNVYEKNKHFNIMWTDKLVANRGSKNFLVTNKGKRQFSYSVQYSLNGGNWTNIPNGNVSGEDFVESERTFSRQFTPTIAGNYKIRVIDLLDGAVNFAETGVFVVSNTPNNPTFNPIVRLLWDDFNSTNKELPKSPLGVAADGTARIKMELLGVSAKDVKGVTVRLKNAEGVTQPSLLGKVMQNCSKSPDEANSASSITAEAVCSQADGKIRFWYVAPDDFSGTLYRNLKKREVFVEFIIKYNNGSNRTITSKIEVVRPPLMLVHGLASNPSTWDEFLKKFNKNLIHVIEKIHIGPDDSFINNADMLKGTRDGKIPNSSEKQSFSAVIEKQNKMGYATNRVDYVCHSMGGQVAKAAILFNSNNFYHPSNYFKGFINKLITINTPHNGSPIANLVTDIITRLNEKIQKNSSIKSKAKYNAAAAVLQALLAKNTDKDFFNFNYILSIKRNQKKASFKEVMLVALSDVGFYTAAPSLAILDLQNNGRGATYGSITTTKNKVAAHLIASDIWAGTQDFKQIPQDYVDMLVRFIEIIQEVAEFFPDKITIDGIEIKTPEFIKNIVKQKDKIEKVKMAIKFLAGLYNSAAFAADSDLVVSLKSQLAGLASNASNVTIFQDGFSPLKYNHLKIHAQLETVEHVIDLLNTPISSNKFGNIPAFNINAGRVESTEGVESSERPVYLTFDSLKVRLLNVPASAKVGDTLNIHITINDTTKLQYTELFFVNQSQYNFNKNDYYEYNIVVPNNDIGKQLVLAKAYYDYGDSSKFVYDTLSIFINHDENTDYLTTDEKIVYLKTGERYVPTYQIGNSKFVANINPDLINADIADNSIISKDNLGVFEAKNEGATRVIVSYQSKQDTLYFLVSNPCYLSAKVVALSNPTICKGDFVMLESISSDSVTYQWYKDGNAIAGATERTYPASLEGNYAVRISKGNCSYLSQPLEVKVLDLPKLDLGKKLYFCKGDTLKLKAQGFETYLWSNGSTDSLFVIKNAGKYWLTVSNSNGCFATDTLQVEQDSLTAEVVSKNISCIGNLDGSIKVSVKKNVGKATIQWQHDAKLTSFEINNLKKGKYVFTIKDSICSYKDSVTINEPDSLTLSAEVRHLTKQQSKDGKINLLPKGGTPFSDGKYKYAWLFPDGSKKTTEDLDSLTSGKYEVVVTDSMGCSAKLVVLIKEPDLLSVSKTIREISCKGAKDGAIELKIHGGVPPYKVFINTQKDTINVTSTNPIVKFSGLDWNNAEPYEILLKDENNTAITVQITLKEPEGSPRLSISKTDFCISDANPTVIVEGLRNGKFAASPAGLVINDSTGIIDIKASRAGSYTISYQNSNATCVANTLKVNVFSYPFKNGFTKMYACGSLTLDAKNEGCTYEWSTKETTRQITVTESGTYKVKINNGTCTIEDEVQVIISKPIITFSKQNVTVFGGNNGSIKIGITGTVGTPTITWADEATKNLLERVNLKAGTYTVSIKDSIGCTASAKIVIEQPAPFKVSLELTHAQGCKEDNGSAAALATGGTPPYTYLWNNGKTTPSIDKLGFGFVSVTVTDANKVTAKAEGYILQADSIITQMKVQDVSCGLATDGIITLQVSGGKAPYSIEGSNGFKATLSKPSEIKITGLAPTQSVPYQLIIRDGQGCVKYLNTMIKVSATPVLALVKGDTVCKGTPAKLTVKYSGKVFPYNFIYSDGKSQQLIRNVEDSLYTFQVNPEKDAVYSLVNVAFGTDCKGNVSGKASVKVNDLPELLNVQVSNENCDNKDAIILISHKEIKNGKAPFEVSIDGGKTFANREKFDSLKAGKYTLIIRDANSCKYEYKQSIEIINSPTACLITRIPNMITPNCDGINDAFEIPELRFYPNCVVAIYDRTGREVFRSEKGYPAPWNPCRDGGNIADLTTYYYQIDLGTGKHQAIRGFIDIKK